MNPLEVKTSQLYLVQTKENVQFLCHKVIYKYFLSIF